jgi:hypothetical protein
MSDPTAASAFAAAHDELQGTAPTIEALGVDAAQVVTSVAQTVQAHPDVPTSRAASVITDILAGLYQAQPAIFAVTRASPRTQAQAVLGLSLAEIIVAALLRRPS